MAPAPHPQHGPEALCAAGTQLYERALREGRVRAADAETAPCLVDLGLLHPARTDLDTLESACPTVALHRLLRASQERIADERRREQRPTGTFEPLLRIGGPRATGGDTPMISVLNGLDRINLAIARPWPTPAPSSSPSTRTPATPGPAPNGTPRP